LRLVLVAWQFLTRVPLPARLAGWVGYQDIWLHASARHFPLVGALVGGVAAAAYGAAALLLTPALAVGLSMATSLLLTGGFHEDGLADTCDGLGGASSRERALEIMKDSRLGAYGAMGLVMVLGMKAAAIVALPMALAMAAMLLAHVVSRAVAVSLLRLLPYAGDAAHAKARPMAQQLSGPGWAVAWGWVALAVSGALLRGVPVSMAAAGLLAAMLAGLYCAHWFRRRLGGYTGDCLGAAQQLSELALYLGVVVAWRWS
jgi:adenosylcobinamide-GDP ribazoletransferase